MLIPAASARARRTADAVQCFQNDAGQEIVKKGVTFVKRTRYVVDSDANEMAATLCGRRFERAP